MADVFRGFCDVDLLVELLFCSPFYRWSKRVLLPRFYVSFLSLVLSSAAVLCGFLTPLHTAYGATYYVRVSGDDTNEGGEAEEAFRTITHAVSVISSGDTVYVGAGTYTQDVTLSSITGATATEFIADTTGTHTGDSGAVIFDVDTNITVLNCQRIELKGFTFSGDAADSIKWTASTDGLIQGCIVNGGLEGIEIDSGSVTLDDVQIQNCTDEGLDINGGTVTVQDTTVSFCVYGIHASNATVTVDNSTISQNSVGVHSYNNDSLTVTNSTISSNTSWGVSVYTSSAPSAVVTFTNCQVHNNLSGVTVVNAEDGDFVLDGATAVRDNTQSGIHFSACTLTVNNQSLGINWTSLRNGYGISCIDSTITLVNIAIDDSAQYGLHCDNSTITVSACAVSGQNGIYATSTNDSLTVESSRFDATATGGWGIARYGGHIDVTNCVVSGFDSGIYLSTGLGTDTASIANSTLGNISIHGIFLQSGDATVINSIIAGNSGLNGLVDTPSQLTHTYNLVHGFTTTFYNTSAGLSEMVKNPRFVDAANGDLHLAKASPAINSGITVGGVSSDFDGNTRPQFDVFDIGAYEFNSGDGSFRVLEWNEN